MNIKMVLDVTNYKDFRWSILDHINVGKVMFWPN